MTFPKRSGQAAQTIVPKVQRLAFNTTENACCEKIVEGLHIGGRLSLAYVQTDQASNVFRQERDPVSPQVK